MRITGGVIALIAGIFGFIAAIVTLLFGGVGAAFSAHGADAVLRFGWGGIAFSFLVIVYGACVVGSKGRWAGYLLIISSIGGAFLGGMLVAICMVLALIGGVLSLFQARSEAEIAKQSKVAVVVAILPFLIASALAAESVYEAKHPADDSESAATVAVPATTKQSEVSPVSGTSVASGDASQVSCKSIPDSLWKAIQDSGAISRGVTGCSDVNIVSRGDIDGDGKADVAAVWSSESSCADHPEEPSGSCGNNVVQFISVQLGSGKITQPVKSDGDATGLTVAPGGLDVDVKLYGPDDPHCCPSLTAVESFALQGDALVDTTGKGDANEGNANQSRAGEGRTSNGDGNEDGVNQVDANSKKCTLVANTAYQAAQIRFDPYSTNEEKMMRLMQNGASADLSAALLPFVTLRPSDSADLLKEVVMEDCLKGEIEAIDSDPRLHPISH